MSAAQDQPRRFTPRGSNGSADEVQHVPGDGDHRGKQHCGADGRHDQRNGDPTNCAARLSRAATRLRSSTPALGAGMRRVYERER
jgi:hypothetical protein